MQQTSERTVSMAIQNPETTGVSRTFHFVGKVDLVAANDDGTATLVDWKCTGDIAQFVARKTLGYQADLYALALGRQTPPIVVSNIEYRLVSIPTIKLCGKDASPGAYENRCFAWLTEEPGRLLAHYIEMGAHRYLAAKFWLWDVAQRILECRRRESWLCNEHACWSWNRSCPYLALCTAQAMGGDANALAAKQYEPKPKHTELEELPAVREGVEILTYSSASLFSLCEMKYYWRHERSLAPKGIDETGESAWTGSAMHAGMDALAQTGQIEKALDAISEWATTNPALGESATAARDQNVAKARAMCRAASLKWFGIEKQAAA